MGNKCYGFTYNHKWRCRTIDQVPVDTISLIIHKSNVKHLDNMGRFKHLKYLEITENPYLQDITGLSGLLYLQHFVCCNNPQLKSMADLDSLIFLYTHKINDNHPDFMYRNDCLK